MAPQRRSPGILGAEASGSLRREAASARNTKSHGEEQALVADRGMSKWRDRYKVHPAADVFPMMSDEELAKLGADIKANGLKSQILLAPIGGIAGIEACELILVDGRNRLEAMELAGLEPDDYDDFVTIRDADLVARIISQNLYRRHLTKQQQADLIVAAHKAAAVEASRHHGEVPTKRHVKGKVGSDKDDLKAAIVADANKHGISKRTVERGIAKAEGKKPAPPKPKVQAVTYPDDPDYLRLLKAYQQAPMETRQRFLKTHTETVAIKNGTHSAACTNEKAVKAAAVGIGRILANLSEDDQKQIVAEMTKVAPDLAWQLRLLLATDGSPWL